jgi:hypothetical protein
MGAVHSLQPLPLTGKPIKREQNPGFRILVAPFSDDSVFNQPFLFASNPVSASSPVF